LSSTGADLKPSFGQQPPSTVEQLLKIIALEYDGLSRQLKVVARHIEATRDRLGVVDIQSLAREWGVQPSAIVRFAKRFGFSGFAEMKKLFRAELTQPHAFRRRQHTRSNEFVDSCPAIGRARQIVAESIRGSVAALERLRCTLDQSAFAHAVDLLVGAHSIWVAGSGHAFPAALRLNYLLPTSIKHVGLFDVPSGMCEAQMRAVRPGDVLIAISLIPSEEETVEIAQGTMRRGARLIAITDSRMSLLAREADVMLEVAQESVALGLPDLIAAFGLVESLCVSLSQRVGQSCRFVESNCGIDREDVT
jgi:DNA-binding MurR/RpiR family transcriptional regulator